MSSYEQPEWGKTLSNCFPIPQRIVMCFMAMMSVANAYAMRSVLSALIMQLVGERNYTSAAVTSESVCPKDVHGDYEYDTVPEDYAWDQELQGLLLSAFFYGYFVTHLPGGIMAHLYGGKWVLSCSILSTSLITIATPYGLRIGGVYILIILRICMGLGQGMVYPALYTLLAHWMPPSERCRLAVFALSGSVFGQLLAEAITHIILNYYSWPIVFYIFGISGIFWVMLFNFMCFNEPHYHPFIRQSEKDYLIAELGIKKKTNFKQIPWKAMFKCKPLYAIIVCEIGFDWGYYMLAIDLPKYMHDVIQINIKEIGVFASIPFIYMLISTITSSFVAEGLINYKWMSVTEVRKIMTGTATVGAGTFIAAVAFVGCDELSVVTFFTAAVFFLGPSTSGLSLLPLDMAHNYAGILEGIINGIGSISGTVVPMLIGALTPNTSMQEWRIVFIIAICIWIFTLLVFLSFASAEVQEWNKIQDAE